VISYNPTCTVVALYGLSLEYDSSVTIYNAVCVKLRNDVSITSSTSIEYRTMFDYIIINVMKYIQVLKHKPANIITKH